MSENGILTLRQAFDLAGLALHPCESGSKAGQRRIRAGRGKTRCPLFMAAIVAARFFA